MIRIINMLIAGLALAMTLGLAACATGAGGAGTASPDPATGACPQEDPDCVDTPELTDGEQVPVDETGVEQSRRDAQFYLGATQDELPEAVRVARIGDEHFALTEDYVIGRITVELDDIDGDGNPAVTSATVELPDGPETFEHAE